MDLWIIAAAAGAGYVAKANFLKNSTARIADISLKTCSCGLHHHSHPQNILQQIRGRTCPLCRLSALEGSTSSTNHGEVQLQNYGINKRNSFLDLSIESLPEFTTTQEVDSSIRLPNSSHLKKRSSWLITELYREDDRLEDYADTSFPSSSMCMKRALTIGSVMNRNSHDFRKEMETRTASLSSQGFSNNHLLIFFTGIAIGMMLVIAYSSREIDNLNELLKKNGNLVHDLYDELEMKDHLTLKELANDGINEQSLCGKPISTEQELKKSLDSEEELYSKKTKNYEAMSKIEAELEAELERLELNMKSSGLGRNFDLIQEDIGVDKVDGEGDIISDSDHEACGSSSDETQTGIYSVPPQELSWRLHEVIQARLQERILELEAALEYSQKRLQALESDL